MDKRPSKTMTPMATLERGRRQAKKQRRQTAQGLATSMIVSGTARLGTIFGSNSLDGAVKKQSDNCKTLELFDITQTSQNL